MGVRRKQYMTVIELARRANVEPHVVRYYARIGLLHPTRHLDNGYKLFCENDVSRLEFIHQAKTLGYRLPEIAEILTDAHHGRSPCPRVREIIEKRIAENRRRLDEMTALQERMERALAQWEEMPDAMPTGESICHLIESVD